MLMGAAVDVAGGPLGATATQLFGAGAGGAIILVLVYFQYRKRSNGLEGKGEAAAMAMLEAIRLDASAARTDASAARAETEDIRRELAHRDTLARKHEAWDRRVLKIMNDNGLITGDIALPPSLVPSADWRNDGATPAGPSGA